MNDQTLDYTPPEGWRIRGDDETAVEGDAFTHDRDGSPWIPASVVALDGCLIGEHTVAALRARFQPNGGFVTTQQPKTPQGGGAVEYLYDSDALDAKYEAGSTFGDRVQATAERFAAADDQRDVKGTYVIVTAAHMQRAADALFAALDSVGQVIPERKAAKPPTPTGYRHADGAVEVFDQTRPSWETATESPVRSTLTDVDRLFPKTPDAGHPEQIPMAGGKAASSKGPAFHLIPTTVFEALAARCELGIERKGDKSWNALSQNQEVVKDLDFAIERTSHIIHHALKLRDKLHAMKLRDQHSSREATTAPFREDDDAGAILWGGMFLSRVVEEILNDWA